MSVGLTLSSRDHMSPPAEGKVWDWSSFLRTAWSLSKSQKASAFLRVPPNMMSYLFQSGRPSKWSALVMRTSFMSSSELITTQLLTPSLMLNIGPKT